MITPCFTIENLSFTYPNAEAPALENLSLTVEEGAFLLLCGKTGSGKTTLLHMLKKEMPPHGTMQGKRLYKGDDIDGLDPRTSASQIGYIMQDPDSQLVCDSVARELAYGLENLGASPERIRRTVAETASLLGLSDIFHARTDQLSGGQKQLVALGSVLAMGARVLLLDEPCSMLDPLAAADFLSVLERLNRETGVTIILTDHRLERTLPLRNQVLLLEAGRIRFLGSPNQSSSAFAAVGLEAALPAAARIYLKTGGTGTCPLSVGEGRQYLSRCVHLKETSAKPAPAPRGEQVLSVRDAWFRYEKKSPDVARGLNLSLYSGEIFALLGANGSGKTTALSLLAGILSPYSGKVKRLVDTALLPQNSKALFLQDTVGEDLRRAATHLGRGREAVEEVATLLEITHLLEQNPRDLSGGQRQKCALCRLLLTDAPLLLLDEPARGLDAPARQELTRILCNLAMQGKSVLFVTHDIEFAAETAHRCGLFFDGTIIAQADAFSFFAESTAYTTAVRRISRGITAPAVTIEQLAAFLEVNREG